MSQLELAQWLYDEFDPNHELEPDACDAQYGPHAGWENLSENDQAYWLSRAEALLTRFGKTPGVDPETFWTCPGCGWVHYSSTPECGSCGYTRREDVA